MGIDLLSEVWMFFSLAALLPPAACICTPLLLLLPCNVNHGLFPVYPGVGDKKENATLLES